MRRTRSDRAGRRRSGRGRGLASRSRTTVRHRRLNSTCQCFRTCSRRTLSVSIRNVLVHDYVALDMARVVEALDDLEPVERFAAIVATMTEV